MVQGCALLSSHTASLRVAVQWSPHRAAQAAAWFFCRYRSWQDAGLAAHGKPSSGVCTRRVHRHCHIIAMSVMDEVPVLQFFLLISNVSELL